MADEDVVNPSLTFADFDSSEPWSETLFRQRDEAIAERDQLREELARLTDALAAERDLLKTQLAEALVGMREWKRSSDLHLVAVQALSSVYDRARTDLCNICKAGICSIHQPSYGVIFSVTQQWEQNNGL